MHTQKYLDSCVIHMPHLLIVESDVPAIESLSKTADKMTSAGSYARVFQSISDQLTFDILLPYANSFEPLSVDYEAYDGFVFTGSDVPWSVDAPEALPLRQIMEATLAAQKPIFGSCNGLHLATVILGGECRAAPMGMEIGLACNITLSAVGQSHPLHRGRAEPYCALSIHRDHVCKVPHGAIVTAGNEHSSVQAMVYEQGNVRFWGTQYHPEHSLRYIIDSISDAGGLFYSEHGILTDLQAAELNPGGAAAKRLGAGPNDLNPQVRQTELRNWLLSLGGGLPGTLA